ncbi:MAG: transposase [Candidatus Margulisiibacteriota bacterium]
MILPGSESNRGKSKGKKAILNRLLKYSDRVYDLKTLLRGIKDRREKPQIETVAAVTSALVMALTHSGSLNALEQTGGSAYWKDLIDGKLPSADTIGNIFSQLDCNGLRFTIRHIYTQLKRNKRLKSILPNGWFAVIVDGHESSCSYHRCCAGCLTRVIHTSEGDRPQYYHRNVTAILLCKDFPLLLDIEEQRPGEDEVAAATRLVERLLKNYPRAFDLVLADGLYARAPFFTMVKSHGKEVIAVLKDDRRDLFQDAMGIFSSQPPTISQEDRTQKQCWDVEHFTTWTQLEKEVRVVRSLETTTIRRQRNKATELKESDWLWVSTASQAKLSTNAVVTFGHKRWTIENECFNELASYWAVNHVYKHNPTAITAFWLIIMLAYNLFHAFVCYNLKPQIRQGHTKDFFAQMIAAVLYFQPCRSP